MIHLRTRFIDRTRRVARKAKDGSIKSLQHAAAALRMIARRSIRRRKGDSRPGQPPHTHTGALRRSILYDVDRAADVAIVGPSANILGQAGAAHEHGGRYKGDLYPARPFMRPALTTLRPRLPRHWAGSIR